VDFEGLALLVESVIRRSIHRFKYRFVYLSVSIYLSFYVDKHIHMYTIVTLQHQSQPGKCLESRCFRVCVCHGTCMRSCVCTRIRIPSVHPDVYVCICMPKCTCMYSLHVWMYACTCACVYSCMHVCMHISVNVQR